MNEDNTMSYCHSFVAEFERITAVTLYSSVRVIANCTCTGCFLSGNTGDVLSLGAANGEIFLWHHCRGRLDIAIPEYYTVMYYATFGGYI